MDYDFSQTEINIEQGTLAITLPLFEFDNFPAVAKVLLQRLDAILIEQEPSADLQQWLIDVEGCQLLLKAEYYSASMWLELLTLNDIEHLIFIQQLLSHY
ncbi:MULTISPECIES: DUF3630 family protein [Photobacterium]|uniref:DUF3630 family protein n=1 Tax=Photobacterium piscicola TaxID=1378299 RepID=A0A1T5I482_9GAMM|nr:MULTISPECIES: DUF3630 family protein [Photobacterium]MEC6824531.1 DUF3630 family protein [Photobacterium piscicola]MEC6883754.1 DUF3630 family protein [Photobacterium piscicola]MEC6899925.1 DUF3630 family protein [Photobacterium piscicola]MEC6908905.1 DUF3630 family protein [Photobacterium piscicola]PST86042.1 DUF3630 domain-containing protein [Photobacterium sp. NCIMB 13483]